MLNTYLFLNFFFINEMTQISPFSIMVSAKHEAKVEVEVERSNDVMGNFVCIFSTTSQGTLPKPSKT